MYGTFPYLYYTVDLVVLTIAAAVAIYHVLITRWDLLFVRARVAIRVGFKCVSFGAKSGFYHASPPRMPRLQSYPSQPNPRTNRLLRFQQERYIAQPSVGYSCVLFAWMTVMCIRTPRYCPMNIEYLCCISIKTTEAVDNRYIEAFFIRSS